MASEAYLKAMKEIPSDIQKDVIKSIDIANEIYKTLKEKEMSSADLARLLNKSESEISKWLTGTHNFTFKTIKKIEVALGEDLLITKSQKIQEYEEIIKKLETDVFKLSKQVNVNLFHKASIPNTPGEYSFQPVDDSYQSVFIQHRRSENIKIKPENKANLKYTLIQN